MCKPANALSLGDTASTGPRVKRTDAEINYFINGLVQKYLIHLAIL